MTYTQVWYIIWIIISSPTDFHSEKIGLIRVTYDPLSVLELINKGCGNKSVYLQIMAILWRYTDLLPHPLLICYWHINLFCHVLHIQFCLIFTFPSQKSFIWGLPDFFVRFYLTGICLNKFLFVSFKSFHGFLYKQCKRYVGFGNSINQ